MKLYDGGRAPNPRRVRVFLAEKGISVSLEQIDLGKFEHRNDAFHGHQSGPADPGADPRRWHRDLRDDRDLPLFRGGAAGARAVRHRSGRPRYRGDVAASARTRSAEPGRARLPPHASRDGDAGGPAGSGLGACERARVEKFLLFLDGHLASREFVCGDAFTVADITGLIAIDFMKPAKLAVPESFAHVRRWHETIAARPSAKA